MIIEELPDWQQRFVLEYKELLTLFYLYLYNKKYIINFIDHPLKL